MSKIFFTEYKGFVRINCLRPFKENDLTQLKAGGIGIQPGQNSNLITNTALPRSSGHDNQRPAIQPQPATLPRAPTNLPTAIPAAGPPPPVPERPPRYEDIFPEPSQTSTNRTEASQNQSSINQQSSQNTVGRRMQFHQPPPRYSNQFFTTDEQSSSLSAGPLPPKHDTRTNPSNENPSVTAKSHSHYSPSNEKKPESAYSHPIDSENIYEEIPQVSKIDLI